MKTIYLQQSRARRRQGSILVITLFTGLTIGIVLASFLTLVASRYKLTARSMSWNVAMPVAEAGVEEALTKLNTSFKSPSSNGWTAATIGGQTVYTKSRTLPDGSYYNVAIYNATTNNPTIYSSGFAPSPLSSGQFISRLVRVNLTNITTAFFRAIATTGPITLNGSTSVDSFHSDKGGYNTATNRSANGGLATTSRAPGAINIGNADIYGTVVTGPGGSVAMGPNGSVGNLAWIASRDGIQPGAFSDTMNASFPANSPPAGPFLTPIAIAGVMTLGNNQYQLASFSDGVNLTPIVVTGRATLYVTGNVNLFNFSQIVINPGAQLTLVVGGNITLSGGGVVNGMGLAQNFSIIGLPTCTSINYSGNAAFTGTINAPQADFTMTGNTDCYGAVIVKSANLTGTASFHYDESLKDTFLLLVNRWQEL
jgi:hypothetical protein